MDRRPSHPQGKEIRRGNDQRRGRKGRRTKDMIGIARERMDILMDQAVKAMHAGDLVKANRYAGLARGIGMRYNVRMRQEHRQMVCRKCGALLVPSKTSTVRIVRGRRIARCLKCGDLCRVPIKVHAGPSSLTVARARTEDEKDQGPADEDTTEDDVE